MLKKIIIILLLIILLALNTIVLSIINIKEILEIENIKLLINNIEEISSIISKSGAFMIVMIILLIVLILIYKYSISISNVSIGGLQFTLRNQDRVVKNSVKNYLSTKRSIFIIKEDLDNFCEVFDSYHAIYVFLREQLLGYNESNKNDSKIFNEITSMIKELNCFLTRNQSHYRNWYNHYVSNLQTDEFCLIDIQRKYPKYSNLIVDFHNLNRKMVQHAKEFDIKIIDWNNSTLEEGVANDNK